MESILQTIQLLYIYNITKIWYYMALYGEIDYIMAICLDTFTLPGWLNGWSMVKLCQYQFPINSENIYSES